MLGLMQTRLNYFFNERTDSRTLDTLTRGLLAARSKAYAQRLHDKGTPSRQAGCNCEPLGRRGLCRVDLDRDRCSKPYLVKGSEQLLPTTRDSPELGIVRGYAELGIAGRPSPNAAA
jgi:hypothetical protein